MLVVLVCNWGRVVVGGEQKCDFGRQWSTGTCAGRILWAAFHPTLDKAEWQPYHIITRDIAVALPVLIGAPIL